MIRGITYDKQLFKSNDFSLMTKKFFNNNDGKVNGCTLTTSGNNVVIGAGWFIASGYYTNIPNQEVVEITENGILVYEIDLSKTNTTQVFNQGSFKVITGTPQKDDLFNNGEIYQMPIANVTTDGTNASISSLIWGDIIGDAVTTDRLVYSITEKTTPQKWIDGKTIYRKVVNIQSLPSDTSDNIRSLELQTGVSNIDEVINIYGTIRKPNVEYGNATFSINSTFPFNRNSNQIFTYYSNNSNTVKIYYGNGFDGSTGYVILEYTKTTD